MKELNVVASKALRLRFLLFCLSLSIAFFAFSEQCFADTVNISPHRIVLCADGSSEDIQARIPMNLSPGYSITDFEASLRFDGNSEVISSSGFYYCPLDNVLHVYFNKDAVLLYLKAHKIEGVVIADVWGQFDEGDASVEFSGSDRVEVLDRGHQNEEPGQRRRRRS